MVRAVERLSERVKELERKPAGGPDRATADALVSGAGELAGVRVVVERGRAPDAKALLELSDTVRQRLGDAAVVLGTAVDGRVHLVANVAPSAGGARVSRPGDVVRAAAQVAGGGGGGRDTMAQAGGRDPEKLPEALATARAAIEKALAACAAMPRILALDHGSARCGCAISDPSGTLATPLPVGGAPRHQARPRRRSRRWSRSTGPSGWWWGFR